jgi:hypothetical protein
VIVIQTIGAPLKRDGVMGRRRRRPSRAEPHDEPEPVAVTRVTVIRGESFDDVEAAQAWLGRHRHADAASREVTDALLLLNHAVHAHRVASGDPYLADVSLARARRVRLGYGTGAELVEGRWAEAYAVPPEVARGRRRRMLAPEEQLAHMLSGRRPAHLSEDLLLRARLDLDQGRTRAAAIQLRSAYDAMKVELEEGNPGAGSAVVSDLASAALTRELTEAEVASLEEAIAGMERAARRRRHATDR